MRRPEVVTDAWTTVMGCMGTPYQCPDEASFNRHIDALTARLGYAYHFPEVLRILRTDRDRLLDCRAALAITHWPPPPKDTP